MKTFKDLTDNDIFDTPIERNGEYKLRKTVKAIIVDENNKIAILKARGHYLLPGGGVEEAENNITAIKRETVEEVGCQIDDIQEIYTSNNFRNKSMLHYEMMFYTAKVIGEKGLPTTTQEDEVKGLEILWLGKDEILKLLESQIHTKDENDYNFCFNARSNFEAFEEYCKLSN